MAVMDGPLEPSSSTISNATEIQDDPSFVNFFSVSSPSLLSLWSSFSYFILLHWFTATQFEIKKKKKIERREGPWRASSLLCIFVTFALEFPLTEPSCNIIYEGYFFYLDYLYFSKPKTKQLKSNYSQLVTRNWNFKFSPQRMECLVPLSKNN